MRAAKRIRRVENRESITRQIVSILGAWRLSKFENEAECRHGLRAALCLRGFSWADADSEAADIVGAGLKRLGAMRPTWLQGQPEGVDRENCLGCGQELDTSDRQLRRVSWCSELCRMATKIRREQADDYRGKGVSQRAFYLAQKQQLRKRNCEFCRASFRPSVEDSRFCSSSCARHARGDILEQKECATCTKTFRPHSRSKAGLYCSPVCASTGRTTKPERPCAHCQRVFKPHRHSQLWCSPTCRAAGMKATLAPRICDHCSETFQPATPKAKFCSAKCRNRSAYDRKAK